ncbi:hypothetical protein AALP_AA6G194500 [Arabis alpina]|uniref:PIPK domain-containing protein n=1 Tax=Arabis alpina TaxID=50452 RepID=A0A087GQA8_ARAAL|nr:hypothetical protein AALP_AA6G194500 [Arabis alpina]
MFLEGCPASLGCTILLKGSDSDELKRVKKVVEYSVTLAYHLILETYFLLDHQEMLSTILSTPQLQESVFDDINRVSLLTNMDDNIETPLDFPSIRVLVSKRNARRRIICDPSHFLDVTFYKNSDVSLEKFLRDLFNLGSRCNTCKELPQAHFYYYELGKFQLRIQLKRLTVGKRLPGEANGNIWMWSRRGKKDVSKKVLISSAACSLFFGKFLDLSFSQQTMLDKLSTSGHSFLQIFGFGYMVAMFSYSQVATYTAVLPQLKLEVAISLRVGWLEKEFQSVITKRTLMFDEVSNCVKQLRSNKKRSGLSLSIIEKILEEERYRYEENAKNVFEQAKTKLLSLNRMRWELFLQALVWNYRLHSLVLQDKDNDFIEVSIELQDDKDSSIAENSVSNGSYNGQWFWISFEELRSKSIVDIEKEYMLKFNIVGKCFQDMVNKIIIEEGSRLHISVGVDHYFVVSDYEDELSSLVACALAYLSSDEKRMLITRCINGSLKKDQKLESLISPEILVTFGLLNSLGKPKFSVVCLYAEDFCDFRKHCGFSELEYIDSLSRCEQRNATDGKEKSMFFKTLNDMFIIKEIKSIEYESFVKFGPEYFKYMKDTYELRNQTCMAKVVGIYQVIIRQPNGRGEIRYNLMVMENLNFGRTISHEYNLKGPLLTRFITPTIGDSAEEVMLGPNFFKDMNNSPIFFSKISKHNLQSVVKNDINFLDSINVMDYSLLVGVELERRELVCRIIGYLKQCTWNMSYPCCIL